MIGLLLGGILWGVLGDKETKRFVWFYPVILTEWFYYKLTQYAVLRFYCQ